MVLKDILKYQMGGKTIWNKLNSTQRRDYIYNAFLKKGYKPIQASAIVGNLQQENATFGTSVQNANSKAKPTGIAQWLGNRKKNLMNDYKEWYDIDNQIDFIHREIQGDRDAWTNNVGGKKAFLNATDIETATKVFRKDFERPGEHEANDIGRIKNAYAVIGKNYTPPQDQSNLPPINGGSGLTYNEGTPLPSTTSSINFWSLPNDIQSTIIENQKLESERLNQEIVANEWEKENLAIEAGLKQKQLERQQVLSTIPQAQYVGQTKLQPNPLTLPQSNVEFMQQGGRVTYNKEGDYYGTEDIEEVIISPQQPFLKNTTDNLRVNRELGASLNLKNYKGKNQVSQDVIKENTPWYLKALAPTTTEKANNIFNDLSNYYNKRNRLPMRVDENSSSLDKEIASNVNSQIGVYSKEENDLRNRISNASTFFYPEGIQDLDNLVSNIENNKQGEAKVKAYFNNEKHTDLTNALTDKYFNVGDTSAFIVPSNYRPTKTTDQNTSYYDFSDTEKRKLIQDLIDNGVDLNFNSYVDKRAKSKNKVLQTGNFYGLNQLGNYTLSGGEDENGKYLSYYDKWDLAASRNKNIDNTINKINNPFEIYGRIYEKDFNLLKNKK